ncbi:MAG: cyclic nucleotide-binding domain-containing protein [Deltaproteobacteria bacterium]|nr:MAG: cyclic nucleotide-binding domain-containing protein [Deltaproteobacteria bacterium]
MKVRDALERAQLFSELDPVYLDLLARVMVERPTRAGEVLVKEGDHPHPVGDVLFLLLEGGIAVQRAQHQGAGRGPIATLSPGDFFGVVSLFDDSPRSATCVVSQPGRVACLGRRTLDALVHSDPKVGLAVELALARQLARDLRMFNRRLGARIAAGPPGPPGGT